MAIYLYLKTHNVTGLKYLGKTTAKDPHRYKGSGKYWKHHIKKHGYDVTTQILLMTDTEEELKVTGMFFSKLWGVVESNEWANLKPEEGDGGSIIFTHEHREKISTTLKGIKRSAETTERMTTASRNSAKLRSTSIKANLNRPENKDKRLKTMKKHLYTEEINESRSKKMKLKRWFNNGSLQLRSYDCPGEQWIAGRLKYKLQTTQCPHCGKIGGSAAMKRWHFEKCKSLLE